MSPSDEEVPLPSGRLTHGVVRVGDTVRRPRNEASPFVARLLARLEACGCKWAPRYLGSDEQGRDVLSYFDGAVAHKWRQFTDPQVARAARILRELHDVTEGSELAPNGVVCHHDPGPNNFVFEGELPFALIDFDMAAPGERAEDLGYLAWSWCVSSNALRAAPAVQAAQVRALADAYGADAELRARLPDAIIERQQRNVTFWSARLDSPGMLLPPARIAEMIAWSHREAAYSARHRELFQQALG